jgi:hypothetical protein
MHIGLVREVPDEKVLGVCWGHQMLARVIGGLARDISSGPVVSIDLGRLCDCTDEWVKAGLVRTKLTARGRRFPRDLAEKGEYVSQHSIH